MAEENKKHHDEKKDRQKDKEDYKKLNEELDYQYKRALADYQNLLKQSAVDKQEFIKYANEQLVLEILPVYDNLKIAFAHADETANNNGWLAGIKHIIKQFKEVLENNGVKEIKSLGEKFDSAKMEAVESKETKEEKMDDVVATELKAGYELNGKIINPARVVVYKYKK